MRSVWFSATLSPLQALQANWKLFIPASGCLKAHLKAPFRKGAAWKELKEKIPFLNICGFLKINFLNCFV